MTLNLQRLETMLVSFIALHSLMLGLAMTLQPIRTLAFFGWNYKGPMFFPTQTGVFLGLFGALFFIFIRYRTLIWFIVVIKATAVVFLVSQYYILSQDAPQTVFIAGIFDGIMGLSVAIIIIWQAMICRKTEKTAERLIFQDNIV